MKKIVSISLFSILLVGAMSLHLISAFPQEMNGISLAEIFTLSLASAEDEPKIPELPKDYESVTCTKTTTTDPDGQTSTTYHLVCYGKGCAVCKCPDNL